MSPRPDAKHRSEHPTVVYVHGSGPQPEPVILKARLDRLLFGARQASARTSRLAYYADILHGGRAHGAAVTGIRAELGALRPMAFVDRLVAEFDPQDEHEVAFVRRLEHRLLGHAQAVEEAPDACAEHVRRWSRPAFRLVLWLVSKDANAYLFRGAAESMRSRLRDEFRATDGPVILVTHSLGSVIAYEVLEEREFRDREVRLLVTLGSPLGLDDIREILRRDAAPGRVPEPVRAWMNFADPLDLVALDRPLREEYAPAERIEEVAVHVPARHHHALAAYLATEPVRTAVLASLHG